MNADMKMIIQPELILMNAEEGHPLAPHRISIHAHGGAFMTMGERRRVKNRWTDKAGGQEGVPDWFRILESAKRAPESIKILEMHVEQGTSSGPRNMEIGLIKCRAGIGRYTIRSTEQTGDSTAPMDNQKDALVCAWLRLSPCLIGDRTGSWWM